MDKKKVIIYTDGAQCFGNPGPGGWAAIMIYENGNVSSKKTISGGERYTTNNKMELKAAINGLKELKNPCQVTLHTDSMYMKHGITIWINKWKINGWKTADKKPVKNMELWKELETVALQHDIDWKWVKAHNGNKYNEEADSLARKETKKLNTENDGLVGEETRTFKPRNFQQYNKRKAGSSASKKNEKFKHQNFQQLPKKKKRKKKLQTLEVGS